MLNLRLRKEGTAEGSNTTSTGDTCGSTEGLDIEKVVKVAGSSSAQPGTKRKADEAALQRDDDDVAKNARTGEGDKEKKKKKKKKRSSSSSSDEFGGRAQHRVAKSERRTGWRREAQRRERSKEERERQQTSQDRRSQRRQSSRVMHCVGRGGGAHVDVRSTVEKHSRAGTTPPSISVEVGAAIRTCQLRPAPWSAGTTNDITRAVIYTAGGPCQLLSKENRRLSLGTRPDGGSGGESEGPIPDQRHALVCRNDPHAEARGEHDPHAAASEEQPSTCGTKQEAQHGRRKLEDSRMRGGANARTEGALRNPKCNALTPQKPASARRNGNYADSQDATQHDQVWRDVVTAREWPDEARMWAIVNRQSDGADPSTDGVQEKSNADIHQRFSAAPSEPTNESTAPVREEPANDDQTRTVRASTQFDCKTKAARVMTAIECVLRVHIQFSTATGRRRLSSYCRSIRSQPMPGNGQREEYLEVPTTRGGRRNSL